MATDKLPPREIISERVEEQRRRVWQAQAICSITALAGRTANHGAKDFAQDTYIAMEAVCELLDDVAGKLEGDVVLDARTDEGVPS